jgi:hypothetical protein
VDFRKYLPDFTFSPFRFWFHLLVSGFITFSLLLFNEDGRMQPVRVVFVPQKIRSIVSTTH